MVLPLDSCHYVRHGHCGDLREGALRPYMRSHHGSGKRWVHHPTRAPRLSQEGFGEAGDQLQNLFSDLDG